MTKEVLQFSRKRQFLEMVLALLTNRLDAKLLTLSKWRNKVVMSNTPTPKEQNGRYRSNHINNNITYEWIT